MTDDLGMEALGGSLTERGAKALAAGCDVLLHCSGFLTDPDEILREMQEVAAVAGVLTGHAQTCASVAETCATTAKNCDSAQIQARFGELMSSLEARA